jgi:hypothetical protein
VAEDGSHVLRHSKREAGPAWQQGAATKSDRGCVESRGDGGDEVEYPRKSRVTKLNQKITYHNHHVIFDELVLMT